MYLSLLAGDTVQAIGFILSFHYIDGPPATPSSPFCSAQGAFIQAGDLSIALSTTLLALHTCYTVLRRRRAHRLVTRLAVPTIWLLVILSALVGPLVQPLFYEWLGFWCWLTPADQRLRLLIHYLWVFVAAGVSLICYSAVFINLRWRDKMAAHQSNASARIDQLAARLVLLPVVYILGVGTLAVNRVIGMTGGTTAPVVSVIGGTLFTLTGCADVVLFSLTRTAVHVRRPSMAALRKVSNSAMNRSGRSGSVEHRSPAVPHASMGEVSSHRTHTVQLAPSKADALSSEPSTPSSV